MAKIKNKRILKNQMYSDNTKNKLWTTKYVDSPLTHWEASVLITIETKSWFYKLTTQTGRTQTVRRFYKNTGLKPLKPQSTILKNVFCLTWTWKGPLIGGNIRKTKTTNFDQYQKIFMKTQWQRHKIISWNLNSRKFYWLLQQKLDGTNLQKWEQLKSSKTTLLTKFQKNIAKFISLICELESIKKLHMKPFTPVILI